MKAVRFDEYGGVGVLKVVDMPRPVPGAGQVLVRVKAAGINPGEATIRAGLVDSRWPATFPLDRVQNAYRRLAEGHVLRKIVLLPQTTA